MMMNMILILMIKMMKMMIMIMIAMILPPSRHHWFIWRNFSSTVWGSANFPLSGGLRLNSKRTE